MKDGVHGRVLAYAMQQCHVLHVGLGGSCRSWTFMSVLEELRRRQLHGDQQWAAPA